MPRRIPIAGPSGLLLLRLCCDKRKWIRDAAAGVTMRGSSVRRVRFVRCIVLRLLLLVDEAADC